VTGKSPNPLRAFWLHSTAGKISDPIDRLRFLRRATRDAIGRQRKPRHRIHYRYLVGTAAAFALLISSRKPTATATANATVPSAFPIYVVSSPPNPPKPLASSKVWIVDRSETLESYSNGLRIDLGSAVSNRPRESYPVFALTGSASPARYGTQPAGIVYHTTESHLAPFEEEQTGRLKKLGSNLRDVLRQKHSYHYVIDRFGRVFRVVAETDVANHSGNSVWADASGIYVNLNSSFIGVAFEAQTGAANEVTPAQIEAGRLLTEMLRSRYSIAAENCVTHAQVSVSPRNMHVGAHVDWAAQFPFASLGLPDNYDLPLPSIYAFGFESDVSFKRSTAGGWKGLKVSTEQLADQAEAAGITTARYRTKLQKRYRSILDAVHDQENEEPVEQTDGGN
jgi:hypothetical protein